MAFDLFSRWRNQGAGSSSQKPNNSAVVSGFLSGQGGYSPSDFASALTPWWKPGMDAAGFANAKTNLAERGALQEAARIRNEQERVGREQGQFLTGEFQRANKPTITDETINRMFGASADQAALDAQELMRSLREHLGGAGVRGGTAAGMAANVALQRYGQVTGARRDMRIFKAKADAEDRLNRYMRALGLAQARNEFFQPSAALYQGLSGAINLGVTQEGIERGRQASDKAAKAAESAGILSGIGGLAGGVLSLF